MPSVNEKRITLVLLISTKKFNQQKGRDYLNKKYRLRHG